MDNKTNQEEFGIKTDVIKMVNEHSAQKRQEKEKQEKARIKKTENKKKAILASIYITAGIAVGALGTNAVHYKQGENRIIEKFKEATDGYHVANMSNGYIITVDNISVSYEDGVAGMINSAEKAGLNDTEIAIGLAAVINDGAAKDIMGELSFKEKYDTCLNAKYAKELEEDKKSNGK